MTSYFDYDIWLKFWYPDICGPIKYLLILMTTPSSRYQEMQSDLVYALDFISCYVDNINT